MVGFELHHYSGCGSDCRGFVPAADTVPGVGIDGQSHLFKVKIARFHPVNTAVTTFDKMDRLVGSISHVIICSLARFGPHGVRPNDSQVVCLRGVVVTKKRESKRSRHFRVQFGIVGPIPWFVISIPVVE